MSDAFDFVLFGGSGDLAMRKLLPALYYRHRDSADASGWRVIGLGRHPLSRDQYLNLALEHCRLHIADKDFSEAAWNAFARQLDYLRLDANDPQDYGALADWLKGADSRTRVFYLATEPGLFAAICKGLGAAGLVTPESHVVLEKPLGRDLASARRINQDVGEIFSEPQVFRIDHYLGKETVQNLIALRFGNVLLEPLWNRSWVRDVQITIAEMVGVEGRGDFYDRTGALRDMVQSHLLQLLCIVAMEPPANIEADTMRDEKLKVLRALRPITAKKWGCARCAASTRQAPSTTSRCRGTWTSPVSPRAAARRLLLRSRRRWATGAGPACRSICAPASGCSSGWPRS